jgi:hypothetical protein
MAEKLVIYTAIMGGIRDNYSRSLVPLKVMGKLDSDTRVVLITDKKGAADYPLVKQGRWELMEPIWGHPNPRRVARYHKLHPHILFPDVDMSIWVDGSQEITTDPRHAFDKYMKEHDIAAFKHPERTCVYQEGRACERLKKDNPQKIQQQMARYRSEGYPNFNGMVETTMTCRRHTSEVEKFNEAWWFELQRGSLRDQLSFNFVSWKLGVPYTHIPGCRDKSPYCKFYPHK